MKTIAVDAIVTLMNSCLGPHINQSINHEYDVVGLRATGAVREEHPTVRLFYVARRFTPLIRASTHPQAEPYHHHCILLVHLPANLHDPLVARLFSPTGAAGRSPTHAPVHARHSLRNRGPPLHAQAADCDRPLHTRELICTELRQIGDERFHRRIDFELYFCVLSNNGAAADDLHAAAWMNEWSLISSLNSSCHNVNECL